MGKKVDVTHVVKLDDTNYPRWKFQVTLVLKAAEVWEVVSRATVRPAATNPDAVKAWEKKDVEAQAIMATTINKHQTNHIYNCTTSKEMFERLKDLNSDSSALNKQHTLSNFLNFKIAPKQSVIEAYLEIEELARSLNEMGVTIDETTVVTKIVSSLPDDQFLAFKKAWDSVPDASQTMPALLARLRKEELQMNQSEKAEKEVEKKSSAAFANFPKSKQSFNGNRKTRAQLEEDKKRLPCHVCGRLGHWARQRKDRKKDFNNGNRRGNGRQNPGSSFRQGPSNFSAFVLREKSETKSEVWFSDSGATQHVTGRKDWLVEFLSFDTPKPVSLSDQNEVDAIGTGTIHIQAFRNGSWSACTINNVLYIPGAVNLFSETVMAQKGYVIGRDRVKTVYYSDGNVPGP